jgi:hypothetical protein
VSPSLRRLALYRGAHAAASQGARGACKEVAATIQLYCSICPVVGSFDGARCSWFTMFKCGIPAVAAEE